MTDCYICGHPILEGQKRGERIVVPVPPNVPNAISAYREEYPHANPADHLPTLDKVTEARLLAEGLLQDRLSHERERGIRSDEVN